MNDTEHRPRDQYKVKTPMKRVIIGWKEGRRERRLKGRERERETERERG